MRKSAVLALVVTVVLGLSVTGYVVNQSSSGPSTASGTQGGPDQVGGTATTSSDIKTILSRCGQDRVCFEREVSESLQTGGPARAVEVFESLSEATNGMYGACQPVGRSLGEMAYASFKMEAFAETRRICGRAFAYGVMFAYGADKTVPDPAKYLSQFCATDPDGASCFYGVGLALSSRLTEGAAAQSACTSAGSAYDASHEKPKVFMWTAVGDCILGWTSSRTSRFATEAIPNLRTLTSLCDGMNAEPLTVCLAEASFEYSYLGSPQPAVRLARLAEIKDRCRTDKSFECAEFLGKGVDDYILYGITANLQDKIQLALAATAIDSICSGAVAEGCVNGVVQAHRTHTSVNDVLILCDAIKNDELASYCRKTAEL